MSEVLTQLPPANSGEALPAGAAPSVSASPADNVTHNNQTPAASSEKPANGTGWGVDLDKVNDSESLAAAIEAMNLPPLPDENAPPEAQAPVAAAPLAPAPAAPLEEALTRPGEIPRNIKMPVRDALDFHVASAIKDARLSGRELSFADAEAQARTALGMTPAAAPAAPFEASPAPAPDPAPSSGAQEQSPDLTAAYDRYQQAREAFDAEAEATALQEINRLNRIETMREIAAAQQQSVTAAQQQEQFNQRWEQTLTTAATAYPDAANPDSALSQRAAEYQQMYAASHDPAQQAIYNSPTSALLYYQLAAADLQVAPQATPAPAPVQKSTPQPVLGRQPPMAALLAGGQSGNPAPAAPSFDPGRIQTSYDLDNIIERMEGQWAA